MSSISSSDPAAAATSRSGVPGRSSASRLSTLAIVLASLFVAVPITASRIAEGILDQTNPDGLKDLSNGLAYLGPILGWSYGALGVLLIALVTVMVSIFRRTRTFGSLKLPLLIVALQIILGAVALSFGAWAQ